MFVDGAWTDTLLRGFLLSGIGLTYVVFLVRMIGLRSFSKMTNFDFVMTIGSGSLLAGAAQATDWMGFVQPMVALTGLFTAQWALARWRKNYDSFEQAIQNDAVLLMRDGEFCKQAMDEERVSKSDLIAKLREANVLELSEVRAVVLETTGDVSVLHGDRLEDVIIENVRSVK